MVAMPALEVHVVLASRIAAAVPDKTFARTISLSYRAFEPILSQVPTMVRPDQTALDVGAWYGPWTRRLAAAARSVVTVEANPELAAFVDRTTPSNVTVVGKAASDEPGTATLWLPPGGRGTEGRASLSKLPGGRAVQVEKIRLDSLDLSDLGLIKIDVEGHERSALLGASGLVEKWRPNLVVEIEDAYSPAAETLDVLSEWDYEGWFFLDGRWRPLAGFDIVAHQREMAGVLKHGYIRCVVTRSAARYVNTVLFRPRGSAR